jgi:5-methyltetrahydrofolate--homocysteine methyltransferase
VGVEQIYAAVIEGDMAGVEAAVKRALEEKTPVKTVLQDGLISPMDEVGRRFEAGDFYVPEMLIAARAMKAGVALLRPLLIEAGVQPLGKVIMGTVSGDLHDIGKNLVGLMLEGAGFQVIDVGTDVSPQAFVEAVRKEQPQILGLSALLTTTMPNAGETVKALKEAGLKDKVKVMVGGAPVTQGFADQIGVDGFAEDAARAVRTAKGLLGLS